MWPRALCLQNSHLRQVCADWLVSNRDAGICHENATHESNICSPVLQASPWGPSPLSVSEPQLPCCCPFCPAVTQPVEWELGVWLGWASIGAENLAGQWDRSYQSASQSIHTEAAFKKHQRPQLKGGIRLWMERDLIHGWSSSSGSPLTLSWAY